MENLNLYEWKYIDLLFVSCENKKFTFNEFQSDFEQLNFMNT